MSIEENQGLSFGFEPDPASDQDIELLSALARNALQYSEESKETSYALHCGSGNVYFRSIVDEGENFTELTITDFDDETLLELLYDEEDKMIAGSIEGEDDDVINDKVLSKTIEQLDDICSLLKMQDLLQDEVHLITFIERLARMYQTRNNTEMLSYINHPSARSVASVIREVIQKRQAPTLIRNHFSHQIEGAGVLGVTGYKIESIDPDDKALYPELVACFEPMHVDKSKDFVLPWPEHGLPVTRIFSEEDDEDLDEEGLNRPNRAIVGMLIGHFVAFLSDELRVEQA